MFEMNKMVMFKLWFVKNDNSLNLTQSVEVKGTFLERQIFSKADQDDLKYFWGL
jgi:hypothetical protein